MAMRISPDAGKIASGAVLVNGPHALDRIVEKGFTKVGDRGP
jgi:hypothetical protein